MKITPVESVGRSRSMRMNANYQDIVGAVGFEPNATHLDDPDKVKASWGFESNDGRRAFIWCYKWYGKPEDCNWWSVDGDLSLLEDLNLL